MANLFAMGIFAIIYLFLFGLVTDNMATFNESEINRANICINNIYPIQDGYVTNYTTVDGNGKAIPPTYDLATGVNGTGFPTTNVNEIVGSRNICRVTGSPTVETEYKLYQKTEFSAIPVGWLLFVGDTVSEFFVKFYSVIVLIGNYMFIVLNAVFPTPTTTILGYELGDINATAQYILTFINITMIVFIVGMIYKFISPFTGGGS